MKFSVFEAEFSYLPSKPPPPFSFPINLGLKKKKSTNSLPFKLVSESAFEVPHIYA